MAISQRHNNRTAALARSMSEGWRVERSCWLGRNAATRRQGKKIANEPLRVKVGEGIPEPIVARDWPQKAGMDVGLGGTDKESCAQSGHARYQSIRQTGAFAASCLISNVGPTAKAHALARNWFMPPRRQRNASILTSTAQRTDALLFVAPFLHCAMACRLSPTIRRPNSISRHRSGVADAMSRVPAAS